MKAEKLGAHVSLVASLDQNYAPTPEPDVDEPRDPHDSHDWRQHDRWAVCEACGVRDYWPGAEGACAPPKPGAETSIPLADAMAILREDLEAFGSWASRKELNERPSMRDWRAEVFEWGRVPGGSK